jgi:hypothetical protein
MDKFEEFGWRIDEGLAKIRNYVENEVASETERRTASFARPWRNWKKPPQRWRRESQDVDRSPELRTKCAAALCFT